jgi:hypothetical protein
MVWSGSIWLRIGTSGGLLWTRWWIFGFLKMLGSSWVAAQLAASQEGLSSVSKQVHSHRPEEQTAFRNRFLESVGNLDTEWSGVPPCKLRVRGSKDRLIKERPIFFRFFVNCTLAYILTKCRKRHRRSWEHELEKWKFWSQNVNS